MFIQWNRFWCNRETRNSVMKWADAKYGIVAPIISKGNTGHDQADSTNPSFNSHTTSNESQAVHSSSLCYFCSTTWHFAGICALRPESTRSVVMLQVTMNRSVVQGKTLERLGNGSSQNWSQILYRWTVSKKTLAAVVSKSPPQKQTHSSLQR